MSINSEALQRKLYDLLDNKGYNPKPMDATGKVTPVPEEAAVIKFDFIKDGENYGKVWISIDGSKKLKIYYGDNVSSSPSDNTSGTPYSDSWTALINHLKNWAQRRQLSFELRNENHLEADMAQRDHMDKKERISEGYYPMGKTASYSDAVPSVKIVIEHSRKIEEGEQRFRNINRIFVENAAGERFLLNTTKPGIARVYARHIAEGGTPYDERGQHIKSLVEEYQKMAGFVRATKNGQFNESTQKLIAEGVNHYNSLRESLSRIASKRGYDMYFESWAPTLMEDDSDTSSLNELFVQETMDPRIESAMPILAKLSKNIREMAEVSELAEWADSLLEGGDGPEASEETDGNTPGDAGEGGAEDADDDLMEAPGAETLAHNEKTEAGNLKAFDLEEGMLDGSGEIDSPVANAITRRILLQRTDLLAKYGPEKVADAIANIADDMSDWIGPDDEIGSSDVSGWVKRVEQELSGLSEGGHEELHPDVYELIDEYIAKVEPDADREEIAQSILDGTIHTSELEYALQPDLEEGILDTVKKVGGKVLDKLGHGSDEDLLKDLKKRAGVHNPQTGKPSMAHSNVEKVDEVDLGQYDAVKTPLKGKDTSDWDKNFREKLALYTKELDQRQKEKKEKSEKIDEDGVAEGYQLDEGMLDGIKQKIAQLAQKIFSPQDMEKMKQAVEQATGKSIDQVSIRDISGKNAVAIATALGAKPTAVNEAKLNELFGLGKEHPKITAMKQRGDSADWIKDAQDELDYQKYGFTGSTLIKRIMSIAVQLGGLGGLVTSVMGGAPMWAGAVALIAFIVGSLLLGTVDEAKYQGVSEGEFAGDYATGEAGQWRNKGPKANKPATIGDLVGENFINTDAQAVVSEEDLEEGMLDWAKEKYHDYQTGRQWNKFGKAQRKGDQAGMQAAQDAAAAHRDKLQVARQNRTGSTLSKDSAMGVGQDVANLKALKQKGLVKEGQEDLDAILRIIKK